MPRTCLKASFMSLSLLNAFPWLLHLTNSCSFAKAKYNVTSSRTPSLLPEFGSLILVEPSLCSPGWPRTCTDPSPSPFECWDDGGEKPPAASTEALLTVTSQLGGEGSLRAKSHHIFEWPMSSEFLHIWMAGEKKSRYFMLWKLDECQIPRCIPLEILARSHALLPFASQWQVRTTTTWFPDPSAKQWIGSVPARLGVWGKGFCIYPRMTGAARGLSSAVSEGSRSGREIENRRKSSLRIGC